MTLEERLNDMIEELEAKNARLEQQLEDATTKFELMRTAWQIHEAFDNDEFSQQMPFPRLEMRLQRQSDIDWYDVQWVYGLVYKHYADQRGNKLLFIPLSSTTSRGGDGTFNSRCKNGVLEIPWRDGFHIRAESALLGVPAFIVCREKGILNEIEGEDLDISGMKSTAKLQNVNT